MQFELNREKEEFFLSLNSVVNMWLAQRSHKCLPTLKEIDNFYVVDKDSIKEYESFAATFTRSELFFPSIPVILRFLKQKSLPVRVIKLYGECFVDFLPHSVDDLYDWIMDTREHEGR